MRLGLAALVCLCSAAYAQPADVGAETEAEAEQPVLATFHAMPGGVHVASAATLPKGVAVVELVSSFGHRPGLLGPDHRFTRASGEVGAAFGVLDALTLALAFEGYYDRHNGFPSGTLSGCGTMCESGWVGAPHVYARYAKPVGRAAVGAQLDVWIPGDVAPSLKLDATSVEARGLAAFAAGPGTLSLDAGFHLDNSANSIDYVTQLSVPDRVSFGISNYSAVLAGAQFAVPLGDRAQLAAETSFVAFVGSPPAGMADLRQESWLLRAALVAGIELADNWSGVAFVEGIKGPGILASQATASDIPIIPYEPMIVGGVGIASRFGGARQIARPLECWETPAGCPSQREPIFGEISGTVTDDAGSPLGGATVTITGKTYGAQTATTNDDGSYKIKVQIGQRTITPTSTGPRSEDKLDESGLEVRVEASGRMVASETLPAPTGATIAVKPIALDPVLPPGQLKGVVRNQRGKPIAGATIAVTPGDNKTESGADGTFAIDLAPGTYKVSVQAKGFRAQELDVTIDPNGVALKEYVLRE